MLKQVSCAAVTQRMDMSGFLDAAGLERETEGALQGGATHGFGGGGSALAAVALGREEEARMAMSLPALTEQEQGALGQGT